MNWDNQNSFGASAITTILVVRDIDTSKRFYLDVLGATLYREYGGHSAVLQFLGNWILLSQSGGPTPDKPGVYFEPPADTSKVSHAFTIRVDNCQEAYEVLRKKGAAFITPPVVNGPETRCFFHDPDGHLFELSEYRQAQE